MNSKILREEKEDILMDILNDKISIKVEENIDKTFNLSFIENITKKTVYDSYKIKYDEKIIDLNLATLSLIILKELESAKEDSRSTICIESNFYKKDKREDCIDDKVISFFPDSYTDQRTDSFYEKNIEKILFKISNAYHKLPKLEYDDKTPGIYHFKDKSAIYLKRNVIGGRDGPIDCGPALVATLNVKELNKYIVKRYTDAGKVGNLEEDLVNVKITKLQAAMEFVFGKKENNNKTVISFDTDRIKELRNKIFLNNREEVKSLKS